jgi:hypothetical protein
MSWGSERVMYTQAPPVRAVEVPPKHTKLCRCPEVLQPRHISFGPVIATVWLICVGFATTGETCAPENRQYKSRMPRQRAMSIGMEADVAEPSTKPTHAVKDTTEQEQDVDKKEQAGAAEEPSCRMSRSLSIGYAVKLSHAFSGWCWGTLSICFVPGSVLTFPRIHDHPFIVISQHAG